MIQRLPHTRLGREHRIEMTPESRWGKCRHTPYRSRRHGYWVSRQDDNCVVYVCITYCAVRVLTHWELFSVMQLSPSDSNDRPRFKSRHISRQHNRVATVSLTKLQCVRALSLRNPAGFTCIMTLLKSRFLSFDLSRWYLKVDIKLTIRFV